MHAFWSRGGRGEKEEEESRRTKKEKKKTGGGERGNPSMYTQIAWQRGCNCRKKAFPTPRTFLQFFLQFWEMGLKIVAWLLGGLVGCLLRWWKWLIGGGNAWFIYFSLSVFSNFRKLGFIGSLTFPFPPHAAGIEEGEGEYKWFALFVFAK